MSSKWNIIFDPDRFAEVWASLQRNRRRTLLTAFGVFWGIFMLVVMLSVGKGIQGGIFAGIDRVPTNQTYCWTNRTTIPYQGFRKGRSWDMKTADLEEIRSKVPELQVLSPVLWGRTVNVVNGSKSKSYSTLGIAGDYHSTCADILVAGRPVNDLDVQQCRKVAMLGKKIVDEVFYGVAPIGKYVQIGGISFQVVGVCDKGSESMNFGSDASETVYMPFTLVQKLYNKGETVEMLCIQAKEDIPVASLEAQIGAILRQRHQISPDDIKALEFVNLDKILQVFRMLGTGIDLLIWIVGMGTLLSGAIGVSNIVMITVKERTNEIGVRRAIGARPSDIVAQIMSESLLITVLAGTLGLMTGVLTMYFVSGIGTLGIGENSITLVDAMLDFKTAASALAVIVATGLLAGLLPARRALRIKAIDAIREE